MCVCVCVCVCVCRCVCVYKCVCTYVYMCVYGTLRACVRVASVCALCVWFVQRVLHRLCSFVCLC